MGMLVHYCVKCGIVFFAFHECLVLSLLPPCCCLVQLLLFFFVLCRFLFRVMACLLAWPSLMGTGDSHTPLSPRSTILFNVNGVCLVCLLLHTVAPVDPGLGSSGCPLTEEARVLSGEAHQEELGGPHQTRCRSGKVRISLLLQTVFTPHRACVSMWVDVFSSPCQDTHTHTHAHTHALIH